MASDIISPCHRSNLVSINKETAAYMVRQEDKLYHKIILIPIRRTISELFIYEENLFSN